MASAGLISNVYSPQSHRVHRGFIRVTEFTEVLLQRFYLFCPSASPDGQNTNNTNCPKGQLQHNPYCYLHPMIMMEYVCAREKRCTLKPDLWSLKFQRRKKMIF